MARHAGQSQISFSDAFFEWLDHQEMVFTEYPYIRMDFQDNLDLALPTGEQWSTMGKMIQPHLCLSALESFCVFKCYQRLIKLICMRIHWTSATSGALVSGS